MRSPLVFTSHSSLSLHHNPRGKKKKKNQATIMIFFPSFLFWIVTEVKKLVHNPALLIRRERHLRTGLNLSSPPLVVCAEDPVLLLPPSPIVILLKAHVPWVLSSFFFLRSAASASSLRPVSVGRFFVMGLGGDGDRVAGLRRTVAWVLIETRLVCSCACIACS